MKYKILTIQLLVLSLALLSFSHSQAQTFRSGLVLGINGSQITGDAMQGFDKSGLHLGVFSEYFTEGYSSLRIDLIYTQKGSRRVLTPNGYGPGIWNLYRADYIEVPIIYNYNLYHFFKKYGGNYDQLLVGVGLGFGWLVNEFQEDINNVRIQTPDFANKFDLSMIFQAEYRWKDRWNPFIAYQFSLYDMSQAKTSPFWKIWGPVSRGYIHVVSSLGVRYYFKAL